MLLSSEDSVAQTNVPVTFGQVFKKGAVIATDNITATLGGTPIELQVDKKATHSDGSLRHAVLTAKILNLGAGASQVITLSKGTATTGPAVKLSDLLATSFDATVSVNIGGTVYTASAKNLLTNSPDKIKTWLEGPLVSEWIVGDSLRDSSNNPHPHLAAYFHVRAYSMNRVRIDYVVENDWTFQPNPGLFTYDVTLKSGSNVVYTTGLNQYHHTRWIKTFWWGNKGKVNALALPDYEYLQATKAVPNYMDGLTPSNAALDKLTQSVEPMDHGDLRTYFPGTGYSPTIGPLPLWDALYLVSGDKRAYKSILANSRAAASYSVHYRDKTTGLPVSIADYPNATIQNSSIPAGSGGNLLTHDQAHQPSMDYLAYLITGDYFYLEEMQFWTTWNFLWAHGGNGGYRQAEKGIFGMQVRGQAWALRNLGQTAYATPDANPLKQYFIDRVGYNLSNIEAKYSNNPSANKLGVIESYNHQDSFAPWMDDFYTWSMGYLVELGFTQAVAMRDYKAKFPTGRMGENADEYCFQMAAPYHIDIGTSDNQADFWPDFKTLYAKFLDASGAQYQAAAALTCNTTDYANNFGVAKGEIVAGRPYSNSSYYANMQPALAIAVDARSEEHTSELQSH